MTAGGKLSSDANSNAPGSNEVLLDPSLGAPVQFEWAAQMPK